MVNFGRPVPKGVMNLAHGGDFVVAIISSPAYPAGSDVHFVITGGSVGEVTWSATVTGDRAEFDVGHEDVQSVIDAKASAFRLRATRPSGGYLVWFEGPINVD